ncbi:MAG: amidohydrolase family protein, partial [bacterium]
MVDIVIENADAILTIDPNGTILKESSIAIDNGRIVGLGAAEDISKQFMAEQTIDGRWKVAIPGLIDTHTHLSQAFQRGLMDEMPLMPWLRKLWVIESKMDKERYKTGVLLACLEKVKTGTTCTVDMTSDADLVAEEAPKSGIRTVIAGVMSDYPELPGTPVGSKEEEIKQAEKWYRKYEGALNGRIHFIFSPVGFPASSPELLKEAAVRARELGARIHTHAAEGPVTRKLCERRYGKGEIELLEDLDFLGPDVHLAHCIQIDDTEVKTIAKYG